MTFARHSLFNLMGLGTPLLLAVVTIPALIHGLGEARFGLLTLVWAVTSYFGLFDLGLGRALTLLLTRRLAQQDEAGAAVAVRTALVWLTVLGGMAALVLAALAPWGVQLIKGVQAPSEALWTIWWMALALPAITVTAGLRGALEAAQAFGWINALRLPMGAWTFFGPWAVLAFAGPDLPLMAAVLMLGRWLGLVAHAFALHRCLPRLSGQGIVEAATGRELLRSGGWMTVSNVVSPLMGYADRFVIGGTVSAAAVSAYATSQELVAKLWIVPGAMTSVLFPAVVARSTLGEREAAERWFRRAVSGLAGLMLPITAGLVLVAEPLLREWIGVEFAREGAPLLQVLAFGAFVNSLAHVPFTYLQGVGAARTTGWIHLLQLPLFLCVLGVSVAHWGAAGAAWVAMGRVVVDALAMFASCAHHMGWKIRAWLTPDLGWGAFGVAIAFGAAKCPIAPGAVLLWFVGCWMCGRPVLRMLRAQWRHA